MKSIPITEARAALGMLANRANLRGERILLTRNGKPVAAIVHFEDAQYMQKKEDDLDIAAADKAMSDGRPSIPFEQVRKELGLDVSHRNQARSTKRTRESA